MMSKANEAPLVLAPESSRELAAGPAGASARHIPALDGIRGLAILWVVLHNTLDDHFAPPGGPLHWVALLAHPGWIGVQVFFALSGFLITAGLLDTQQAGNYFAGFYLRRALRILPLYYGVLFLTLVVFPRAILPPAELQVSVDHQISLWLFIVNWTHAPVFGFVHFWSLAVEEQFYLFWPLIVYRLSPRRLLVLCLGLSVAALLARGVMRAAGAGSWTLYTATICRMDALALGAAGACLIRIPSLRQRLARSFRLMEIGALGLFLLGIPLTDFYDYATVTCQTFGYTLLAVCSAVMVTGAAMEVETGWVKRALDWKSLRSCGKYSYAIYIFHELIHVLVSERWLAAHFGAQPPAYVVLAASAATLLASYGLAFVSYHGFEKRFLALKRLARPTALRVRTARLT